MRAFARVRVGKSTFYFVRRLVAGLLLLELEEGPERSSGYLDDLESYSGAERG